MTLLSLEACELKQTRVFDRNELPVCNGRLETGHRILRYDTSGVTGRRYGSVKILGWPDALIHRLDGSRLWMFGLRKEGRA
jgi:hypothetical protein